MVIAGSADLMTRTGTMLWTACLQFFVAEQSALAATLTDYVHERAG
jgi:hypothetical protein